MKKLITIAIPCLVFTIAGAQDKYFTRDGHISFFSSTPVEDIDAHNHKATSILDKTTGAIEFAVLMKAFEFKKALMQEHFNENYVESNKYPKGTFKGTIAEIANVDFGKDGKYAVNVVGALTIHGATKTIEAPATLEMKDGKLTGTSEFKVKLSDFNIVVPSVVEDNIAKEIKVTIRTNYEPFTK